MPSFLKEEETQASNTSLTQGTQRADKPHLLTQGCGSHAHNALKEYNSCVIHVTYKLMKEEGKDASEEKGRCSV